MDKNNFIEIFFNANKEKIDLIDLLIKELNLDVEDVIYEALENSDDCRINFNDLLYAIFLIYFDKEN